MASRSVNPWAATWPAARNHPPGAIEQVLSAARDYLGLDAAFVSRATNGKVVIQYASRGSARLIEIGADPASANDLCRRILEGRQPSLIANDFASSDLADAPPAAHFSVPLTLSNGTVHGTFCCFSRHADPTRVDQDRKVLATYARLAAAQIETEMASAERYRRETAARR